MFEAMLGSVLGGALRLAPEIMKVWDRGNERKHELALQDKQLEFEKLRAQGKLAELGAQTDIAALEALKSAYAQQAAADGNAYKWAASVSSLVRPVVTFGLVILYASLKAHSPSWTEADHALLGTVVGFWFVSRAVQR